MRTISICFMLVIALTLSSCGPSKNSEDYQNSLSVKEFLFDNGYYLMVDGIKVTKYNDDADVNCKGKNILELYDSETNIKVSEMLLLEADYWQKFPDRDIYVMLFKGG